MSERKYKVLGVYEENGGASVKADWCHHGCWAGAVPTPAEVPPPPPALAWMAPRFSISCSGLEDPRRTELTPSFLRHQAGNKVTRGSGTWVSPHSITPGPNVCQGFQLCLKINDIICLNFHFIPPAPPGGRNTGQITASIADFPASHPTQVPGTCLNCLVWFVPVTNHRDSLLGYFNRWSFLQQIGQVFFNLGSQQHEELLIKQKANTNPISF